MNTSRSDMTVSVHILESWDESPLAKDRIQTGLTQKKKQASYRLQRYCLNVLLQPFLFKRLYTKLHISFTLLGMAPKKSTKAEKKEAGTKKIEIKGVMVRHVFFSALAAASPQHAHKPESEDERSINTPLVVRGSASAH